eukprot:6481289-Amphidinium_carterae.2
MNLFLRATTVCLKAHTPSCYPIRWAMEHAALLSPPTTMTNVDKFLKSLSTARRTQGLPSHLVKCQCIRLHTPLVHWSWVSSALTLLGLTMLSHRCVRAERTPQRCPTDSGQTKLPIRRPAKTPFGGRALYEEQLRPLAHQRLPPPSTSCCGRDQKRTHQGAQPDPTDRLRPRAEHFTELLLCLLPLLGAREPCLTLLH